MPRRARFALFAALALAAASAPAAAIPPLGDHVVLSWNDLGMHCMNQWHADFEVLPPFNNLQAQVIRRGTLTTRPQLLTTGFTLDYSIPGNTTSVGKTDFWTYAPAIFGVTLPPDVGLTGKGLTGTLDPAGGSLFEAKGIPVTPFDDAEPTVEKPYQKALVIARDAQGHELARSTPVIPVSVEVNCVSSGCHSSINSMLNGHPRVSGFDPAVRPILCAKCHASPALGTTGRADAKYFSFQLHDRHQFLDRQMTGVDLCNKCHPGPKTQCLRGAMRQQHGLTCQSCHGNMATMARSIENGRVPWANEPQCGTCHGAAFAENPGKLYRMSTGHGGVACEACHGSTHADFPSREANDNANNIALQGYAGVLRECAVCHGDGAPNYGGPHVAMTTGVGDNLVAGAAKLAVYPNPMRTSCSFTMSAAPALSGRLLINDAQGRVVRMLDATPSGTRVTLAWDGRSYRGERVAPGTYFARWQQEGRPTAAARVVVVR
ncbi:MAG: FlgD immunoglobulin-like domain containing protein [Vicinamibacterales bacterium]